MNDNKDIFDSVLANRNPALFFRTVLLVVNRDGQRIQENLSGAFKAHCMLSNILSRFVRIPFKTILQSDSPLSFKYTMTGYSSKQNE